MIDTGCYYYFPNFKSYYSCSQALAQKSSFCYLVNACHSFPNNLAFSDMLIFTFYCANYSLRTFIYIQKGDSFFGVFNQFFRSFSCSVDLVKNGFFLIAKELCRFDRKDGDCNCWSLQESYYCFSSFAILSYFSFYSGVKACHFSEIYSDDSLTLWQRESPCYFINSRISKLKIMNLFRFLFL